MPNNLDDIKTVQDLLNIQENESPQSKEETIAQEIASKCLDESPTVGLIIVESLLTALLEFHNEVVDMYVNENQAVYAAQWAHDSAKLRIALESIKDIEL